MSADPFLPFTDFVKSLQNKTAARNIGDRAGVPSSPAAIENMRTYLVQYYKKTQAEHSFQDEEGQVWDCMPIKLQPSLRGRKDNRFKNVPEYPGEKWSEEKTYTKPNGISRKEVDSLGNKQGCPEGTIPVRRLTLERMASFKSVQQFLRKDYREKEPAASRPRKLVAAATTAERKYVYARHFITNKGGGCTLNIWQPPLHNQNQLFSLSQLWTIGGRGVQQQTIEVGWQVCPLHYGHSKPALFIYWTPDNYRTGSYNMEQSETFVQANSSWRLGGALSPVSTIAGTQIDMRVDWILINTAWWLYINETPVGYYPKRLFGNGALTKLADAVVVGGEVSGNGSWAPMGSGQYADQGYGRAAYIRNISYLDEGSINRPAHLSPVLTSENCYKFEYAQEPDWGSSFFYGGPGGNHC